MLLYYLVIPKKKLVEFVQFFAAIPEYLIKENNRVSVWYHCKNLEK